ncbi:unnamed protein product [Ambrosiozyma monospora]|uniref:Unnamed protein product n=1 Tax=Ambrosiozyma monospora TaxID=43982 RepID=A0ACB5U254_AMBMO|nr:unnamed protein product [Ambrosiozyma monospora]
MTFYPILKRNNSTINSVPPLLTLTLVPVVLVAMVKQVVTHSVVPLVEIHLVDSPMVKLKEIHLPGLVFHLKICLVVWVKVVVEVVVEPWNIWLVKILKC